MQMREQFEEVTAASSLPSSFPHATGQTRYRGSRMAGDSLETSKDSSDSTAEEAEQMEEEGNRPQAAAEEDQPRVSIYSVFKKVQDSCVKTSLN